MSLIKLNNNSLDNLTSFEGSASLGDMVFISSATASASSSIEFTLGDLKEYKFFFVNMHPQTNDVSFEFNFSTDSGSNYNVTKTSTYFRTFHDEADTSTGLAYYTTQDLAQSTAFQNICSALSNDNDASVVGTMTLFNPSSTTYVKHWVSNFNFYHDANYTFNHYIAGYANTTSALTNIKFQMSSGNIDDGKILCFGLN